MAQQSFFKAEISKSEFKLKENVMTTLKNALKSALFIEALRNLNWSREYCWYCELDGVPNPFQRGGVLGLPCKQIQFSIAESTNYSFTCSSMETIDVPRAMNNLGTITLDLYDDEQMTLTRFFERWYNYVYNPFKGVLPVTEACKLLTIYKQKSTRRNVRRVYYNIDTNISNLVGMGLSYLTKGKLPINTEGYDFLVYPSGSLQQSWSTDSNNLNSVSVSLQVAHFMNQDFANPDYSLGITDIFGETSGIIHKGTDFIDKLADYI